MLTNPSTIGVFENEIHKVAEILHAKGALLYMDGANMNALVGKVRPGDFGVDVMHLNLHKTFSTPHGGGGPGSGPVACKAFLEPFLPMPVLVRKAGTEGLGTRDGQGGDLHWEYDRPQSVGRVRAFYGNTGMFIRALAYILANGPDGLRQTTEDAVLNANYIRKKLEDLYEVPYQTPSMHEVVFSDKRQAAKGVKTGDIAKRLIDYGFHPYTVSFPHDCARRADDRADRERVAGGAEPVCGRDAVDCARGGGDAGAGEDGSALYPRFAAGRSAGGAESHPPLEKDRELGRETVPGRQF